MEPKKVNKLSSRKLWFAIWAAALLTYATISQLEITWFGGVAPVLASIVVAYVLGNAYIKGKNGGGNE